MFLPNILRLQKPYYVYIKHIHMVFANIHGKISEICEKRLQQPQYVNDKRNMFFPNVICFLQTYYDFNKRIMIFANVI